MKTKSVTHATNLGQRSEQQDAFIRSFDSKYGTLLGVFDGHGGDEASKLCAKHVSSHFFECLDGAVLSELALGDTLINAANNLRHYDAGTTASLAYLPLAEDAVYTAVIGDSPIIVGQRGLFWLSPQHNVRSNVAERTAAQMRGGSYSQGYIWNGFSGPGLQMSRALGDAAMGKVISNVPDIKRLEVSEYDFVLVGSDGLFDPRNEDTDKAAQTLVEKIQSGATAEDLVAYALSVPTGDNVTAVLARF